MAVRGIYIQVGAGAGDQDARAGYRDGFTEYVKALPPDTVGRIIVVEPNPRNLEALAQCWRDYPSAEIYCLGVAPLEGTLRFYYAESDAPHFQVMSMNAEHVASHYPGEPVRSIEVPCLPLSDFIRRAVGSARVELLALDIEGIEAEVILATDWTQVPCRSLSFELIHGSSHLRV